MNKLIISFILLNLNIGKAQTIDSCGLFFTDDIENYWDLVVPPTLLYVSYAMLDKTKDFQNQHDSASMYYFIYECHNDTNCFVNKFREFMESKELRMNNNCFWFKFTNRPSIYSKLICPELKDKIDSLKQRYDWVRYNQIETDISYLSDEYPGYLFRFYTIYPSVYYYSYISNIDQYNNFITIGKGDQFCKKMKFLHFFKSHVLSREPPYLLRKGLKLRPEFVYDSLYQVPPAIKDVGRR